LDGRLLSLSCARLPIMRWSRFLGYDLQNRKFVCGGSI
jgi:hypothetical protein